MLLQRGRATGMVINGLIGTLGLPFVGSQRKPMESSNFLYRIALTNKVSLTYLSKCICDEKCVKLHGYHFLWLRAVLDVLARLLVFLRSMVFAILF